MIAFYQRLSGSNPTVVICSYSIDCFKTKIRKKIISLFSFLYHILKIYSAMQPYDLFENIMFIFLEISIWNVYILLPICPKSPCRNFSTKTTFRDELLIIRYSADEEV